MPVILIVLILLLAPHTAQAEALRGSWFAATSAKPDGALAGLFVGRSPGVCLPHDPISVWGRNTL